ncbi:MAG: pilus (MSHA type) biogenesis protein MshL [Thermodesulfobacteriota bacterium]
MKTLVALKGMNVSWANDVNQFVPVDVDIRSGDDFFKAIDNILQQASYFYEIQGNTIAVKNRETRTFHVPLPNVSTVYATTVGGDVLGASSISDRNTGAMAGKLQLTSEKNEFNFWKNIEENFDRILEVTTAQKKEESEKKKEIESVTEGYAKRAQAGAKGKGGAYTEAEESKELTSETSVSTLRDFKAGLGYYTIDKHLGLISVTASRPMLDKIGRYLETLKKELYRQVAIEAKIVEVIINDEEKKGIDWSNLLNTSLNMEMFGPNGIVYKAGSSVDRAVSQVSINPAVGAAPNGNPFNVLISALETQGPTNILANPKISVLNGQPALISVGDTMKYIDTIDSRVDAQTGAVTYSVKTATLMSGLGMSVIASIMDSNEVVLTLTPVTSKLDGDVIPYEEVGLGKVGVPKIQLREMNTVVRVKSGDMLMIGGLIDDVQASNIKKVPFLGDLPGVGGLFSHSTNTHKKKELVILLQPKII